MNKLLAKWQANFLAGLAIMLPAMISIAVVLWLFGTLEYISRALLIFLPKKLTHQDDGLGPMFWYWNLLGLFLAAMLIAGVGHQARHLIGRKLLALMDLILSRVPLLNKVYTTTKQVNEALTSHHKPSFSRVVLIEFPREGQYSIGFVTGDNHLEIDHRTGQTLISVFIPITPFLTSGYILFLPEAKVTHLEMTVAEGIKYIVSLGSIPPRPRASGDQAVPGEPPRPTAPRA